MKISFIEPHLKLYGGIRRIIEFANRLTERGHDVTIFHSDGSPCNWMKCIAKVKPYNEVLSENHDVIIYNDPNPIDYYLVKKAKAKLKVFYILALYERDLLKGINPKIYLPFPWNKRMLLLKKSLKSLYLKLSNSTWIYRWLKENMNIDSKLLIGGINTDIFRPVNVEKNHNEIRILCSGDPRKRKGTSTILEAIKIVKSVEPRVVLDTYYNKGISQERMAEKYSSADIFVDGQWYAGWNNPAAEAMACKVPVVCTDIGGVQDFAFHEKTALLVPPREPEAMASAILRLIRDKELRESLRENAYQLIKKFDWDKSVDRLEEILKAELSAKNFFNLSYIGQRGDVLSLISDKTRKVLDVGCSIGILGESIKGKTNAEVIGIELNEQMAKLAKKRIDKVIIGDIEKIRLEDYFPYGYFNYIVFADILEHLKDPWEILGKAGRFLSDDGAIVASIPNIGHYTTIVSLLFKRYWPYRDRGIHDRSHLRFFTLKNIKDMFQNAGLKIIRVEYNYRIIERPHKFNKLSKYIAIFPFRDLLTFQYLIVARKEQRRL